MSTFKKLWTPSPSFIQNAHLSKYANWLQQKAGLQFTDYATLWQWTADNPEAFWKSIMDYFQVICHEQPNAIKTDDPMPYMQWFPGATLNYAEHVFRKKTTDRPAILFASEKEDLASTSWEELEQQTASLQQYLKEMGVGKGDRVAAYIPNIPQATVAMLATISIGAVWSSCSPDFGSGSVLDRYRQIEPKLLIVADGYSYNGKEYDKTDAINEISSQLPSVQKVVVIPYLKREIDVEKYHRAISWTAIMQRPSGVLEFVAVPFSHPIWILYSSGTTGIPKAITHSHGGMLLEHLKYLSFHNDVHEGENFFWYSTTGWMMWNFVQAALLVGATIVLYDGSPGYPDISRLWKLAADLPIHHFGTSAPFIMACLKSGIKPGSEFDLSALRSIGSTGSPLPPEGFDYVYESIKNDVWLCSMSGGTDICTAFVGGNPWDAVYEGRIQCRTLGCSMYAFNENGEPIVGEVGEMVVTQPMPCMPIYFWNDKDYKRYLESYFEMYPGVWRHGDWLQIDEDGQLIISGRSDTTLNRQGIRIGTAEIYRAVDKIAVIKDSLIVNVELPGGGDYMPLFVVMQSGRSLNEEVIKSIRTQLRTDFSPRHVPDDIIEVVDLPFTISGKKMESPVKKILMGASIEKAANPGAMRNPESLDFFLKFAKDKNLMG